MGSMSVPHWADAPQQELPSPVVTRRAAAPYRSFTTSLMSGALILLLLNIDKDKLFAACDALRLNGFVAGAALGIQEAQQFRQGLGIRRIAQERAFAPH